jgi:alanine dehydrogenase
MIVGIPKEIKTEEYRVGLTPAGARELTIKGHKVLVESDAASRIGLTNEAYQLAGASIVESRDDIYSQAELIVKVKEPQLEECQLLRQEQTIFTYLHLAAFPEISNALISCGATCVAYETITDKNGRLPLLAPMSEVAGRMSVQAAAHFLEITQGGSGVLLAGAPGVAPGKVLILGGGVVGRNAAQIAVGLGAEVVIIDRSAAKMRELEEYFTNRATTLYSSQDEIERQLATSDVVVGAVLVTGAAAPKLVSREMLQLMRPGSVVVDVAIDQGGCFETSKATTHDDPVYDVDGILHYCVANMPGAVPRTSTFALTSATLPYVIEFAESGVLESLKNDSNTLNGLNLYRGQVTHEAVALALNKEAVDPLQLLS